MALTFLQLQQRFATANGDLSSAWAAGGASNKSALNEALDELYDDIRQSGVIRNMFKTAKTAVTFTGTTGALPADFLELAETDQGVTPVFPAVYGGYVDGIYTPIPQDAYRVRYDQATALYYLEFNMPPSTAISVEYVKALADLSADGDVPKIPAQFHPFIVDYAMPIYFRAQRDWSNFGQSKQVAEGLVQGEIQKVW